MLNLRNPYKFQKMTIDKNVREELIRRLEKFIQQYPAEADKKFLQLDKEDYSPKSLLIEFVQQTHKGTKLANDYESYLRMKFPK